MLVLLTRPKDESLRLKKILAAKGVKSVIEPLITIKSLKISLNYKPQDIFIVTSKTAAKIVAGYKVIKAAKVFVVGKESLKILKESGFKNAVYAGKNIAALKKKLKTGKGQLIYLSGDIVSDDLKQYISKRIIIYKTAEIKSFSKVNQNLIKKNRISHVLFYSSRSADVFARLIKKNNLNKSMVETSCLCLSKAIADKARKINWKELLAVKNPTEKVLLSRLITVLRRDGYEFQCR